MSDLTLTCVRQAHNPAQTYEEFVQARLVGWGGSDIGSLANSGQYSCKRRLFLERLALLDSDRGEGARHHLERGKFLEGPVAELYAKRTGRTVGVTGTAYIKEYPQVRANADRLVYATDRVGEGVLEIKCPSQHSFKKIKNEGIPEAYILQLQWQMLCYGVQWGSFAVYWADGHELLHFDMERDEGICQALFDMGVREWHELLVKKEKLLAGHDIGSFLPEPHLPSHTACARCPSFESCHALQPSDAVIVRDDMAPIAQQYSEIGDQIKSLEKQRDTLKDEIREQFALNPAEAIRAGVYQISVCEQSREFLSPDVKKELTPEQVVRYTKHTKYETVTVKVAKEKKG